MKLLGEGSLGMRVFREIFLRGVLCAKIEGLYYMYVIQFLNIPCAISQSYLIGIWISLGFWSIHGSHMVFID